MNVLMTSRDVQREYTERLQTMERDRQGWEIRHRLRLRRQLRKAILEAARLEGGAQDLAREFSGLVRSAESRLGKRACC